MTKSAWQYSKVLTLGLPLELKLVSSLTKFFDNDTIQADQN
ncbi:hypothetical protein AVDCRST_MAG81-3593 [uncultured Synechococcales cyanobacterium]|uniref:Uncharacterized protein n=1 Tax=uncultured Synechococcales cyanobacterium TaxID=1936017 RepID=A0A6J4VSV9_9CYAN|nr:hypothetical protein AVDCRST_MAG81-3593 [uncultured Synechococcales cyanobacterium]